MLLRPKHLDPQILEEQSKLTIVNLDSPNTTIYTIDPSKLDLINKLLQTNQTASSLEEYYEIAKNIDSKWILKKGLLKYQDWLVVADEQNLRTKLIVEVHNQVSIAHLGKNKTRKVICARYYWQGITIDIDQFVQNCNNCCRSSIP